jgi:hypothetical protein
MSGTTRQCRHHCVDSKCVQHRSRDVLIFRTYKGECRALRFLFSSKLKAMAYTQLSYGSRDG